MKKVLSILLAVLLLVTVAFATGSGKSLDDVLNEEASSSSSEAQNENSNNTSSDDKKDETKKSIFDGLGGAADMSEPAEGVAEATSALQKIVTVVVQFLMYAITLLLTLRVVLDIGYIVLPFVRGFLDGGASANGGAMAAGAQGMNGMSPMGGMGMGGMGAMGGMGYGNRMGGYGANRMGMGMGMSPMGGMGAMGAMGGMGAQGAQPMGLGRQIVSDAAIQAVTAHAVDQNGKPKSPLMMYATDMTVTLIVVPILLVLAITGILTDVGLAVGQLISQGLSNMSFMQ